MSKDTAKSGDLQDMSFKVDPEFHRMYKMAATQHGMTMKELCETVFWAWLAQHPPERVGELMRLGWSIRREARNAGVR